MSDRAYIEPILEAIPAARQEEAPIKVGKPSRQCKIRRAIGCRAQLESHDVLSGIDCRPVSHKFDVRSRSRARRSLPRRVFPSGAGEGREIVP